MLCLRSPRSLKLWNDTFLKWYKEYTMPSEDECKTCWFYTKECCEISGHAEPEDGWCCRYILRNSIITSNQIKDFRNE